MKFVTRDTIGASLNVLLLPVLAFIISLKILEFFSINILLIIVALIFTIKNLWLNDLPQQFTRLTKLDLAIVGIAVIELCSYSVSDYPANSFYFLSDFFFFLLFYCLVRVNLREQYQRLGIFILLVVWGIVLVAFGFGSFYHLNRFLSSVGLSDITNFRNSINILTPPGLAIGEWITLFFALLPFPLILLIRFKDSRILRIVFFLAFVAIVLMMCLTFIRGVYVALAIFFAGNVSLFCIYRVFSVRKVFGLAALALFVILLALIPVFKPVITTASMLKTTSQVRSFQARRNIWSNSVDMVRRHPWLGIGANNFAMEYVAFKNPDEEIGAVLRPFSYFLQILIEKGVLGLLAYLLLSAAILLTAHRQIKHWHERPYQQSIVILFTATYLAVLVRDLSDSSIFSNHGLQILLWFVFACLAQPAQTFENNTQFHQGPPFRHQLLWLTLVVLVAFCGLQWRLIARQQAESKLTSSINNLDRGEFDRAENDLAVANRITPDNAQYLAHQAIAGERSLNLDFDYARFNGLKLGATEIQRLKPAIDAYKQVVRLNPADDFAYHNLGWLYWLSNQKNDAFDAMKKANAIDNNVPLYHISLGIFYEYEGNVQAARGEYVRALQISPGLLDSRFFHNLQRRSNEEGEAIRRETISMLETDLRAHSSPVTKAKLGKLHLSDSPGKAFALLKEASYELPGLYKPWLSLGAMYDSLGDKDQAEACYKRGQFLSGNDSSASLKLAEFYDKNNRYEEAANYYRLSHSAFLRLASFHANKVRRIYISNATKRNDVIPQGLLYYLYPEIDIYSLTSRLAEMYLKAGNIEQANRYREMKEKLSSSAGFN